MQRILGLPRNIAIAILALSIFAIFLLLALLLFSSGKLSGGPSAIAGTTTAVTDAPTNVPIDLLKLVEPAQDTTKGTWTRDGTSLTTTADAQSQIEFPYVPPEQYDLRITFQHDQGQGAVAVVCAAGGKQFVWRMAPVGLSGFALVDGQAFGSNRSTQKIGPWEHDGQPTTLLFKFRPDHIDVLLDDKPLTTFQTDYHEFSLNPLFNQHSPNTCGFFVMGPTTLQSAQIIEVAGHGHPSR